MVYNQQELIERENVIKYIEFYMNFVRDPIKSPKSKTNVSYQNSCTLRKRVRDEACELIAKKSFLCYMAPL